MTLTPSELVKEAVRLATGPAFDGPVYYDNAVREIGRALADDHTEAQIQRLLTAAGRDGSLVRSARQLLGPGSTEAEKLAASLLDRAVLRLPT